MPIVDPGPDATLSNRKGKRAPTPTWYAIINSKVMWPNHTQREIGALVHCSPVLVDRVLNTTWAKARLERGLDIRPHITQHLRIQSLDSLDATSKAVRRLNSELDKRKPQPAVL